MSEPQLERSVLEAKEREELYAIADALGTKPGSRAKKADLITQILRAVGAEPEPAEPVEKPRRTRARKAATEPVTEADGLPAAAASLTGDAALPAGSQPAPSRAANGRAVTSRPTLAAPTQPVDSTQQFSLALPDQLERPGADAPATGAAGARQEHADPAPIRITPEAARVVQ